MSKRVLVVDDEQAILELLAEVLGAEGYVVDVAENAADAIELIREHMYAAAILDFNLPDMDGVRLHRTIRQMDAELALRTLFTSGLVQSDDNLGYYAHESGGFLPKPFQIGEVLRAVHELTDIAADD
jgi:DNA-binding response OmpR family regulator